MFSGIFFPLLQRMLTGGLNQTDTLSQISLFVKLGFAFSVHCHCEARSAVAILVGKGGEIASLRSQ